MVGKVLWVFSNPDPVGIRSGDPNFRRFVQNNPVRWVDPWGLSSETTLITYDPLDRERSKHVASSQLTSHTYDPAGRQTSIINTQIGTGVILSAHTATYDSVGNRLGVLETVDTNGAFGTTYTYDAANQLLSEVRYGLRSYSNTFTYDPAGNQISVTPANGQPTTNSYNAANAVVLSTPGAGGGQPTTFTYDAAGNRLSKLAAGVPTTYTWDYENRNTLTYPSGQVQTRVPYLGGQGPSILLQSLLDRSFCQHNQQRVRRMMT